ncbi:hypothetical protein JCM6882_008371 [Rhodosporidiobolus microsporus]
MDQTSSTGGRPARVSLLDLPPELLSQIFGEAFSRWWCASKGPICRALLPFHLESLHRQPLIYSLASLAKLIAHLDRQPQQALLVKRLTLSINPLGMRLSLEEAGEPLPVDEGIPSEDDVTRFFRRLTRVETVSVSGNSRLCRILLTPSLTADPSFLPNLEELRLEGEDDSDAQPYPPAYAEALQHYPSLSFLYLGSIQPATPTRSSASSTTLPLPQLRSLAASAMAGLPESSRFLSQFANLAFLRLYRCLVEPDPLLLALPSPSLLQELCVTPHEHDEPWLPTIVSRFTSLQRLQLPRGCDCTTPAFFDILRTLPLVILRLGDVEHTSSAECIDLVSGPRRHRTLQTLVIEGPVSGTGDSVADEPLPWFYDHSRSVCTLQEDWRLPVWTNLFSREGCRQLLDAVSVPGAVQLRGEVTKALAREERWHAEVAMLTQMCKAYGRWQQRKSGSPVWMGERKAWIRAASRR